MHEEASTALLPSPSHSIPRLLNLPQFLLIDITQLLDDSADQVCLALTCHALYDIVAKALRVEQVQKNRLKWAKTPVYRSRPAGYRGVGRGGLSRSGISDVSKEVDARDNTVLRLGLNSYRRGGMWPYGIGRPENDTTRFVEIPDRQNFMPRLADWDRMAGYELCPTCKNIYIREVRQRESDNRAGMTAEGESELQREAEAEGPKERIPVAEVEKAMSNLLSDHHMDWVEHENVHECKSCRSSREDREYEGSGWPDSEEEREREYEEDSRPDWWYKKRGRAYY